jgi:maleamate amidohydrolase
MPKHLESRCWDRFFTEQDRVASGINASPRIGFGRVPALLLVDLYRSAFGDKPEPLLKAVKTWPGSCGLAGWQALPHIKKLLKASRDAGIPIIHTAGIYAEEVGLNSWSPHGTKRREGLTPSAEARFRHRYDFIDELMPIKGEAVVRKPSFSAFWNTPIVSHLTALGVDTIITCGETTSGCVRASVVEGCSFNYRMIIAEECTFDRTEASHAINLFDMNRKYADVVQTEEVISHLHKAANRSARTAT